MPASLAGPPQSGAVDATNANANNATPEQLYLHVVGRWPGPELGYPADHSDVHGHGGGAPIGTTDNQVPPDQVDDAPGASARAKKRRKVQRRAKVSEIWFPRAEMAFCTCVASIPPNGRTKIKFFGRPLGRNELIAAICTLATRRLYNRKQISSHSQVLKDKVPQPLKEIFTFEDKSRGTDEPGESSTANVIENYVFPDSIYNIIGYRVGSDLANAPKPKWLCDLESGIIDNGQAPTGDSATPRAYSYWANGPADYPAYYDRGGGSAGGIGPVRGSKDRDGRGSSSSASGMALSTTSLDSPYYQYGQQSPGVRPPPPFGSHGPGPHPLPPLDSQQAGDAPGLGSGRFSFTQSGASGPGITPQTARSRVGHPPWAWDEQNRSPTSTASYDAPQSQGSATTLSPRQGAWSDTKPDLTLPPLQDGQSGAYGDWKDRPLYGEPNNNKWGAQPSTLPSAQSSAIRGGALPSMSAMPSFGSVASQANNYGVGPAGATAWSSSSGEYGTPGWDGAAASVTRGRTESLNRLGSFIPASLEVTAHTAEAVIPLTTNDQLTSQPPIPWYSIYMWQTRYPFLEQVAQAPGVPVYHVDVPISLPADPSQRAALSERVTEFGLHTALRPLVSETTGWAITSDSGFFHPATGPVRYPRSVTPLRTQPNGELTGSVRLGEIARLYEHFVHAESPPLDDSRRPGDSFASVALPMSALIQRVVRDNSPDARTPPQQALALPPTLGSDWATAAAIIIYSFWVAESWGPPVISCRPVDFDGAPGSDAVAAEQLAAGLLAGEEAQPSKFDWL